MSRALRIIHPGARYHITARGIERRPIYKDIRDRRHFLELLEELGERFRLRLHAYILMENHYHLLIELVRDRILVGGAQFIQKVKAGARAGLSGKAGLTAWAREPVTLVEVISVVEKVRGAKWEEFKDRHNDRGRDLVLYLARKATELTVSQLARAAGLKRHTNVSMAVKRYKLLLEKNNVERQSAQRAAELLHVTL